MKKISLLICGLILGSLPCLAQNENGYGREMLEFGGFFGFNQYYGDVSNKSYFQKFSGETKPSFGFFGRFHFNQLHGLGLGFNRMSHYSFKENYSNNIPLNYEFSGKSNAFFLHSFLNMSNLFWGVSDRKLNLYGTLGIGYMSWQSTLINLQNNSIIVDFTDAGSKNLRSEGFYFPASIGLQLRISPTVSIFAEGTYSTLISDDLDYYRDGYQYDILVKTHFGLCFALPLNTSTAPSASSPKPSRDVSSRRTAPTTPVYVIDYEKFPEMPGERIIPRELPVLDAPQPAPIQTPAPQPISNEVEYRVQIYASSRKIINPQALFKNIQFDSPIVENMANWLYRYSTGSFKTYSEAESYAKHLQNRGIHDAFVVAYQNNQRISITPQMKSR